MKATRVSICIPTCHRPGLLVETIESCLKQTHENIEILIGDDSADNCTEALVASRYSDEPRIVYVKNEPPLKQADNITSLFNRAKGEKILLIHDDDTLTPSCIEKLLTAWIVNPATEIAFGDQYEMDDLGRVHHEVSEQLNIDFMRTEEARGFQPVPAEVGLKQMIPNNGWMANADLVKQIGYKKRYGDGCEFVFGVEICMAAKKIYYLKEYVSYYRKTRVSMSLGTARSLTSAPVMVYNFLRTLKVDPAIKPAYNVALKRAVPIVVSIYARNHRPMKALGIALAHLKVYRYGTSPRFFYHLALIAKGFASPRSYLPKLQTN